MGSEASTRPENCRGHNARPGAEFEVRKDDSRGKVLVRKQPVYVGPASPSALARRYGECCKFPSEVWTTSPGRQVVFMHFETSRINFLQLQTYLTVHG